MQQLLYPRSSRIFFLEWMEKKKIEIELWRGTREAFYDAVQLWVKGDRAGAALLLRLAIKRTEILIVWLEKWTS